MFMCFHRYGTLLSNTSDKNYKNAAVGIEIIKFVQYNFLTTELLMLFHALEGAGDLIRDILAVFQHPRFSMTPASTTPVSPATASRRHMQSSTASCGRGGHIGSRGSRGR